MIKKYYGTELYHHGVQGQKWGQRLYQYEDGSLTPLGKARRQAQLKKKERAVEAKKKRQVKEQKRAERRAKRADRKALKEAREAAKRKQTKIVRVHDLSKYSDDELREKTNRLRVENDYLRAMEDYARLNPRAISAGERFFTGLRKAAASSLSQAASNVGRDFAEKRLRKMLLPEEEKPSRDDRLKKYGLDTMSDEELSAKVKRMAQEDTYIRSMEGKNNNKKNN
jgi:hypothetical protein